MKCNYEKVCHSIDSSPRDTVRWSKRKAGQRIKQFSQETNHTCLCEKKVITSSCDLPHCRSVRTEQSLERAEEELGRVKKQLEDKQGMS
jgi:hypothetical protein